MNRREFVFSLGAASFLAGCDRRAILENPELRLGVISDLHVTTRKSCRFFKRALRYFRSRGVEAVVIPGDLTDWGLESSLTYVKESWDSVFAGTAVVPLFITGNHDYDGWRYGDMTMEMHANGYSEDENLKRLGMAKVWEKVFGEPFAPVRCRQVKGYSFLSCEWEAHDGKALKEWIDRHGGELPKDRPFFFFMHPPVGGTTGDSGTKQGLVAQTLGAFPNCIAFTGHTHQTFQNEKMIWQGQFTSIAVPSLSYIYIPGGHENGNGNTQGKSRQTMPPIQARRDLRGSQGFLVDVWKDRVVVERLDVEEGETCAPNWEFPLPVAGSKPYRNGVRDGVEPVPQFPMGAELDLETRNTENRVGRWTIAMNCEFPSARVPEGHRVYDYEIRAVPTDGSRPLVKRFFSPAFARLPKYEPKTQRFWFDVAELPQDKDYILEVRAFNCFGKSGQPLTSPVLHGKPGLGKARTKW